MKPDVCPDGPFTIEMKVGIIDVDGNTGWVTYVLPAGKVPTEESVLAGLKASAEAALAHDHVLMNRHEFVSDQLGLDGSEKFRLTP